MASDNKVLSLASKAGHILLENGAEISRVEDTMERIATHYGEKSENFFVLSNGIFTTGSGYANVEFIPIKGARLDKVVEVNQLSRDIVSKDLPVEEAEARLEQISASAPKPAWEQLLGAAFGSARSFFRFAIRPPMVSTACTVLVSNVRIVEISTVDSFS